VPSNFHRAARTQYADGILKRAVTENMLVANDEDTSSMEPGDGSAQIADAARTE
jgi:hypothetical protein